MGAKLLYRLPRGVDLTPAGEVLRRHAHTILTAIDRLGAELSEFAEGIRGKVRILANRSSLTEFLPEDLSSFARRFPTITIDLAEESSAAILKAVNDGHADIGIYTAGVAEPDQIESVEYRTDRMVLIVPADHPFADRVSMEFREALVAPLVALAADSAWDAMIAAAARKAGIPAQLKFRLRSIDAVCRMVGAGFGVSVIPRGIYSTVSRDVNVRSVDLEESFVHRSLRIAFRKATDLDVPVRLILKHLTEPKTLQS